MGVIYETISFGGIIGMNDMDKVLEEAFVKIKATRQEEESWTKFRNSAEPICRYLGNAFCLYFYMRRYINRSTEHETWAHLDRYYLDGYLAFAQHQTYIAKKFSVSQSTVSRWLKSLVDEKLIRILGEESVRLGANIIPITIYGLGRWADFVIEGKLKHEEIFYADYVNDPITTVIEGGL